MGGSFREGEDRGQLSLGGLYNAYNAAAAIAAGDALGIARATTYDALASFRPRFGRQERFEIDGTSVLLMLAKNPAGTNAILEDLGPEAAAVVVALNDRAADGRDVSWIWDVDFEPLIPGLTRLVATGDRAAELALRFKYGGLEAGAIDVLPSLEAALDRGLELTPAGDELVVLPTYTAMLALRRIVGDRGFVRPYWESAA